ncbi:hypothetical protein E1B28_010224 [Marasmius oreades]|uniref:Alpha/beta hydrolase fold-3 domain-containing protein n=1 Tax=Marasmius oreades TaxID=181124 RepID=A0A9P7UQX5_9AGAR|nr:uncharacterized protein E1B28_010224 [Marasmius oreades]KAG7091172.1 hypothetical protein E1B28_010224 [Marasmius oreades]
MPVNALTRNVGLRVGPIILERLIKHYFDRLKNDLQQGVDKTKDVQLRQDELLYDEAFHIIKAFLDASTYHTVEEMQEFSNYRTISPPWVHVVRVIVPMSCCDEAAGYLITALGGENVTRRVVGGVKWWQVRSINGVDAQWITAKKDWQEHKRRYKMQDRAARENEAYSAVDSGTYEKDMDEMRCILYSHGGGYYFGSVDQGRYAIQRYARKINGRVFAINYRLAPQYPFPCALQDLVAAYLYLIRPPPDAKHRPIHPGHIVIAGDSAGGGLSLALLQVIRDTGLPIPAGGVLISPWCDLTHSFPSIHTNTDTDVIPPHGLSMHKPSTLWPPPPPEMTRGVHNGLRSRIRQTFKLEDRNATSTVLTFNQNLTDTSSKMPVDVGATTPFPQPDSSFDKQSFSLTTKDGEVLTIDSQLQLYTVNSLLFHPLVSPALSYLGGLPALLFIVSDKEVLRDEIVYTAHKAAYPDKYPVKDEVRTIYPSLHGIEDRFDGTPVHVQIYDDTAHVLPALFPFTTPGKFCHRAIASFCRYVTKMTVPSTPVTDSFASTSDTSPSRMQSLKLRTSKSALLGTISSVARKPSGSSRVPSKKSSLDSHHTEDSAGQDVSTSQRTASQGGKRGFSLMRRKSTSVPPPPPLEEKCSSHSMGQGPNPPLSAPSWSFFVSDGPPSNSSEPSYIVEPKFADMISSAPSTLHEERYAGDPIVYSESVDFPSIRTAMIRERVSTRGVIRPLEPESELDACCVPHEMIGALSELAIRRYFDGRKKFDTKFASTIRAIEKHRRKHLERAKKDTIRNMNVIQNSLEREEQMKKGEGSNSGIKEGLLASSGWTWAWALDSDEHPPPSSIVSRRDTSEALELARIADHAVLQEEGVALSGNSLWGFVSNMLTNLPEKHPRRGEVATGHEEENHVGGKQPSRKKSLLSLSSKFLPRSPKS